MRCKSFTLPLDAEAALDCERKIDGFMNANNVKRIFASLANPPEGPAWSVLFLYEGEAPAAQPPSPGTTAAYERRPSSPVADAGVSLSGAEVKSILALKKWRADAAAVEGVPLYMVAQNRWLEEMVRMPAKTLDDLRKIGGFSEWRVQKYGPRIVEILNSANAARRSWSASS